MDTMISEYFENAQDAFGNRVGNIYVLKGDYPVYSIYWVLLLKEGLEKHVASTLTKVAQKFYYSCKDAEYVLENYKSELDILRKYDGTTELGVVNMILDNVLLLCDGKAYHIEVEVEECV